jgi:tripartite ATP-independent transporter DctM subunit
MPPSVPMVIAGTAVGISIGRMFAGGIIPGLMIGFSFLGLVYIIAVKRNYPKHRRHSFREILATAKEAIWALLAPFVLLTGVLGGFFTPTEAAVVTVLYALIAGTFIYRELKLIDIYRNVAKTMRTAATILLLMGLANVFGSILIMEQIPQTVARLILGFSENPIVIIILLNLFLLVVGLFMDAMAAIMITFPFLMPVAVAAGMDPIHFAVMACINLFIGLITPPFGLCIATAAQIGNVSLWPSYKAAFPFVIMLLVILMIVAFVPQTVLWLPGIFFG